MPDSDKIQHADKDSCFLKLSVWLTIIAAVAVAVLLILLGVTDNAEVSQTRSENGYTCVENYNCQEIEDANAPMGIRKKYTFTLDNNIDTDTTLAFYTVHQYVEVWLEEEKVFCLMPSENNHVIKTVEKERQLAEKDRELAENERKLTDRRIASMMSQIRSHFIFNVLTTISTYCKIEPKKADNALVRFQDTCEKILKS